MAFLGKEYTLVRDENFDEYLKSVGFPEDKIKGYLSVKSTSKLEKNGDTYTYTTDTASGLREGSFKPGVEFSDMIGTAPVKNIFTINGNTVDQVIKSEKGEALIRREYNGDDLVVTITSNTWDGVAKRYYKA